MAKQLLITASEVMELTIWNTRSKLRSARARQLTGTVRDGEKIKGYDLNKIDSRFIKPKPYDIISGQLTQVNFKEQPVKI